MESNGRLPRVSTACLAILDQNLRNVFRALSPGPTKGMQLGLTSTSFLPPNLIFKWLGVGHNILVRELVLSLRAAQHLVQRETFAGRYRRAVSD